MSPKAAALLATFPARQGHIDLDVSVFEQDADSIDVVSWLYGLEETMDLLIDENFTVDTLEIPFSGLLELLVGTDPSPE